VHIPDGFLNPVTVVLTYAVFLVYLAYVVNNGQVKMECRSDYLVKENVIENVSLKKPLLFGVIKELNISYEKVLNILRELRKNLDN